MDAIDNRPRDRCFRCGKPSVVHQVQIRSFSSSCGGPMCKDCAKSAIISNGELRVSFEIMSLNREVERLATDGLTDDECRN